MSDEDDSVEVFAVMEDGREVYLASFCDMGDVGSSFKEFYPNFFDEVEEANIKFSQIRELRVRLPKGYFVD